jgi:hypothetical protein
MSSRCFLCAAIATARFSLSLAIAQLPRLAPVAFCAARGGFFLQVPDAGLSSPSRCRSSGAVGPGLRPWSGPTALPEFVQQ